MSVLSVQDYAGPFAPDGVTTAFPFTFAALSADEVAVVRVPSDWADIDELTGYTVQLNANGSGTVTFTTPPLAGDPLYIVSDPSFEQQIRISNQGKFAAAAIEKAFDRSAVRDIVLMAAISRSVLAPPADTLGVLPDVEMRAGMVLGFDAAGQAIPVNPGGSDSAMRTDLAAVPGATLVGTATGGTVQSKLNALRAPSEQATDFATGLKIGDPALFGYDNTAPVQIYYDFGAMAAVRMLSRIVVAAKGDGSSNFNPAIAQYIEVRDRDDVDATNKGALTGSFVSVAPRTPRNNVGIDDVVGYTLVNTSGITTAKATDGYYIGENPLFTAAGTDEWLSAFTVDAHVTFGYQMKYRPSSGQLSRWPNNCSLYQRNAGNTADVRTIGLDASNYVQIGDSNAAGVDINIPVRSLRWPVTAQVTGATYTVAASDRNITFNGGGCTVTLPAAATFAGRELRLRSVGGVIISASANVVPLAGGSAGTALLSAAGKWAILFSDGAAWQIQAAN